jgi:hypothetical protein
MTTSLSFTQDEMLELRKLLNIGPNQKVTTQRLLRALRLGSLGVQLSFRPAHETQALNDLAQRRKTKRSS